MRQFLSAALAMACAGFAYGQVVDGTRDANYGAPLAVQGVQTQFGDANPNGGSELDAAYARISGNRLFVLLTGNIEANFNKINVFIDSRAGGENVMTNVPKYDFNNNSQKYGGLRFDVGFTPDFHLFGRWGNSNGPFEVDFVDRAGGANMTVPWSNAVGSNGVPFLSSGVITAGSANGGGSGTALTQNLPFAMNGTNVLGVLGGTGAADTAAAAAVTTGFEFSIDLADLGNPAGPIRIAAMIGNGNHDYLSNQVLGTLDPRGNLGGDGGGGFTGSLSGIDFTQYAGLQYFEIPGPGAAGLLGIGGLFAMRRRRIA